MLMTRIVVVSVFGLALATGALAQTTPTETGPRGSFQSVKEEHPDWFTSNRPYKPCPSSVAFNGRSACLGCPTRCRGHF
jgi:hypothetical protein